MGWGPGRAGERGSSGLGRSGGAARREIQTAPQPAPAPASAPPPPPYLGARREAAVVAAEQAARDAVLAVGEEGEWEAPDPAHHLLPLREVAVLQHLSGAGGGPGA
jgi:hypothetical protein